MKSRGLGGEYGFSAPLAWNSGSGVTVCGAGELRTSPAWLGHSILSRLMMVENWFCVQRALKILRAHDLRVISPSVLEVLGFSICLVTILITLVMQV